MMVRRRLTAVALGALLAVVAGVTAACGGASGASNGGSAAGLAPADVLGFASVDTDWASTQIKSAEAVLNKFPFHVRLEAELSKAIASGGTNVDQLKSSVGTELDIAVLKVNGKTSEVGFTKPKDEKQFEATLGQGSSPSKYESIGGWVVFSEDQAALDAVKNRTANLADADGFKAAQKALPSDTLATVYVDHSAFASLGALASSAAGSAGATAGSAGAAAGSIGLAGLSKVDWLSAAATSHDDGLEVEFHVHGAAASGGGSSSAQSLADEIPGGALLAASFDGGGSGSSVLGSVTTSSSAAALLARLKTLLGVSAQDLVRTLDGPTIIYIRPGALLPEVTLATKPADPQQAETTLETLVKTLTKSSTPATTVTVDGVTLQQQSVGPVAVYYGIVDGQLLITDNQLAVSEIRAKDNRLSDDDTFKAAKTASGLPDSSGGWLYVNLTDGIPAVEGFAGLAGKTIPPTVDQNLKPLRSFVVYGTHDGDTQSVVLFLQTN